MLTQVHALIHTHAQAQPPSTQTRMHKYAHIRIIPHHTDSMHTYIIITHTDTHTRKSTPLSLSLFQTRTHTGGNVWDGILAAGKNNGELNYMKAWTSCWSNEQKLGKRHGWEWKRSGGKNDSPAINFDCECAQPLGGNSGERERE